MTYFIDDLKAYLVTNTLMASTDPLEFFDEVQKVNLIRLACYDNDPTMGRYSFQFLGRDTTLSTSRNKLFTIYNHFFNYREPKPVYKEINNYKCLFKPVSKPTFVNKDAVGMFNYVMSIEVWTQKQ